MRSLGWGGVEGGGQVPEGFLDEVWTEKSLKEREILNSIKFWRILILYSPFPTLTIH